MAGGVGKGHPRELPVLGRGKGSEEEKKMVELRKDKFLTSIKFNRKETFLFSIKSIECVKFQQNEKFSGKV